jgi:hypothetical protein
MNIFIRTSDNVVPLPMWLESPCTDTSVVHRSCECSDCVLVRIAIATTLDSEVREHNTVITTECEKPKPALMWFVIGFLSATFLMILFIEGGPVWR